MRLKVIIQPGEVSGFVANVPGLPGCWSQGTTREEALANVREAAEGWIEVQEERLVRPGVKSQIEQINI